MQTVVREGTRLCHWMINTRACVHHSLAAELVLCFTDTLSLYLGRKELFRCNNRCTFYTLFGMLRQKKNLVYHTQS